MDLDALYTLPPTALLRGSVLNMLTAESQHSRFCALETSGRISSRGGSGRDNIKLCKDYMMRRVVKHRQLDNNDITEKPLSFKDKRLHFLI